MYPIRCRTSRLSLGNFAPATSIRPSVGGKYPVSIRIVVDFPAPFGPKKPTTSPFSTEKVIPRTASPPAYLFIKFSTWIITNLKFYKPYPKGQVNRSGNPLDNRLTRRFPWVCESLPSSIKRGVSERPPPPSISRLGRLRQVVAFSWSISIPKPMPPVGSG